MITLIGLAVPPYFLIGFERTAEQFFIFYGAACLLTTLGVALGIAVGSQSDVVDDAMKLIMPLLMPLMLFSGPRRERRGEACEVSPHPLTASAHCIHSPAWRGRLHDPLRAHTPGLSVDLLRGMSCPTPPHASQRIQQQQRSAAASHRVNMAAVLCPVAPAWPFEGSARLGSCHLTAGRSPTRTWDTLCSPSSSTASTS